MSKSVPNADAAKRQLKSKQSKETEPESETEAEWCARIESIKPSGTKGLAFVLREIKKAQM